MRKGIRQLGCLLLSISILSSSFTTTSSTAYGNVTAQATSAVSAKNMNETTSTEFVGELTYTDALAEYEKNAYTNAPVGTKIELLPEEATIGTGEVSTYLQSGNNGKALETLKENQFAQWEFLVEQDGLYEIILDYKADSGNGSKIQRKFSIDGEVPFQEANNISFYRHYEEYGEVTVNAIGDEVWPSIKEVNVWSTVPVVDNKGYYAEPLKFYFTKGKHTLRIDYVDQPMLIGKVKIQAPEVLPTYEEVKKGYEEAGYKNATAAPIKFQAEAASWRNTSTIRRETDTDPKCEPYSATNRVLNILGGSRWSEGNQSITWKFLVKEPGLYKINLKANQGFNEGMPSYRQIEIDGQIPFEELKEYSFEYKSGWEAYTIQDDNEEPYLFYFEPGEHEITMTVKVGRVQEIVSETMVYIEYLSALVRKITKITGTNPDTNYEYNLYRTMPELADELTYVADGLEACADIFKDISNVTSTMEKNYREIIANLRYFAEDTDRVIKAFSDLTEMQTNLGSYLLEMVAMPLRLDYFEITKPDETFKIEKSNFFEKIWITFANFLSSFTKDYDSVGSKKVDDEAKVIDVWIARGTEWGEILKNLVDEDFTKKTGINVNVNIIPSGQLNAGSVSMLMLAINSGKAPDVALGLDYSSPAEFAFRDAVVDLSKFDDFKEYSEQFYETMFVPYSYNGGVYALPETMDFTVLIYRKDIMQELGLEIPSTWDELYQNTLPKLYENNMGFSFPVDSAAASNSPSSLRGMTMLLSQKGGSYYTDDGMFSNLDSEKAFSAFKEWTQLYTNYGLDAESNFFTRMRTGIMPIGVGEYATYMKFLNAAPELYGRWGIAPMLGTVKEDGSIDRTVGGISSTANAIMAQSDKQEESWEFMKWWMETETQIKFGREVEATLGTAARWNTANIEAFESLPWDQDDLLIIKEQMSLAKEQPIVLGGYFTTRHLVNAWNRVVIGNKNERDSLEEAVVEINKELRNKHEEYGFIYNDDK